jgi:hypothetical protein
MFARIVVATVTFAALLGLATAAIGDGPASVPDGTVILLTEGIVGGIIPPRVRSQVVIVPDSASYRVMRLERPAPPDQQDVALVRGALVQPDAVDKLIKELDKLRLWGLPVESPQGCEDIYRLDTSLVVRADSLFWGNGGPAGCVHGTSTVQPTAAQKKTFEAALEAVRQFTTRAKLEASSESYAAVLKRARGRLFPAPGK